MLYLKLEGNIGGICSLWVNYIGSQRSFVPGLPNFQNQ